MGAQYPVWRPPGPRRSSAALHRNAVDALSDVLKSVRLEGAVYLNAEFTSPWCIRGELGLASVRKRLASAEHVAFFHYLTDGECKVQLLGSRDFLGPTRPGGLPTDIDHHRAGTHQLIGMRERCIGARKAATIAEAIGSDVEDADEDRLVE